MRLALEAGLLALGMYSTIPVPRLRTWKCPQAKDYALLFYVLLPLVCGLVDLGVWWGLSRVALPPLAAAILLMLTHQALTGWIHWDGYADVQDALSSHQDRDRKVEIMHDSALGALGALKTFAQMLLHMALLGSILSYLGAARSRGALTWATTTQVLSLLIFGEVLGRAGLAYMAYRLPKVQKKGYLYSFSGEADGGGEEPGAFLKKAGEPAKEPGEPTKEPGESAKEPANNAGGSPKKIQIYLAQAEFLLALPCLLLADPTPWKLASLFIILLTLFYLAWARQLFLKEFGGISGDLCGYGLITHQAWVLAGVLGSLILGFSV